VPRVGRSFCTVVLRGWGLDELVADAELITSELAANVVQAATEKACLCGFTTTDPAALDDHLLTAFASGSARPLHGFTRPAGERRGG
jgi:hypothetical protein